MKEASIRECLEFFDENQYRYKIFCKSELAFFEENERLNMRPLPCIHSLKFRIKSRESLEHKLNRKWNKGVEVTKLNFGKEITDVCGIRVLHIYNGQFPIIHEEIMKNITIHKEWVLFEQPKAYIWDKEKEIEYQKMGLVVETKDSYYTSFHYVIKPNEESDICCEIQVRTLFEEAWGEIDHTINYPDKTKSIACAEQIKVMARLVNAGSRLADAIFTSYKEHASLK